MPDVSLASIKGLQGLKFVDKTVAGTPTLEEARDEVRRVSFCYLDTGWPKKMY